ncbi:unnamed protein product [Discosporangium mesarthrocarpum]
MLVRKALASSNPALEIELFYDVASPYTWLAFETLVRYTSIWDADIRFRPFFLGGVMNSTGNKPPGQLKAKAKYMVEDTRRMARHFSVPLRQPSDPTVILRTLQAQRLLTATSVDHPGLLVALSRELWMRLWGRDQAIDTSEGLVEACTLAGLSAEATRSLMARSREGEIKERLKAETQVAVDRGAFGAPCIFVRVTARPGCGETTGAGAGPGVKPQKAGMGQKGAKDEEEAEEEEEGGHWQHYFGCDRFEAMAEAFAQPWYGPCPGPSRRPDYGVGAGGDEEVARVPPSSRL